VENITDKGYYTNSFHYDVRKNPTPFEKLDFEKDYPKYCSGGFIHYCEYPNMRQNPKALEAVWDYAYDRVGDLGRLGQLGINQEGHLVILDYGFGYETFSQYNPTPYQQANKQAQEYNDFDDNEDKKYDKYGNIIAKPKTVVNNSGKTPELKSPKTSSDIPF
jgi:hypothetical protein